MDGLLNFLADNYIYFMIGAGVLLLALIGFFVDGKRKKKKEEEEIPVENTASVGAPEEVMQTPLTEMPQTTQTLDNNINPVPAEPTLNFDANAQAEPESIFTVPQAAQESAIGEPISMPEQPAPIEQTPVIPEPTVEVTPEVPVAPVIEEPVATEQPVVEPTPAVETVPEPTVAQTLETPAQESPISMTPETPVNTENNI